jgi:hypothetical protein
MPIKLDKREARNDLTDREVAKIICGTLYSLVDLSDIETIKRAVQWIAEHDEVWQQMEMIKRTFEAVRMGTEPTSS